MTAKIMTKIYDAENQILGRFSSVIAKRLLGGETIAVVNVAKAVVSGNPKVIKEAYLVKVQRGDPYKGPFFPKTPDGIFRRTVRGMLPWDKTRGREAYKRLHVFADVPEKIDGKKVDEKTMEKVKSADAGKLKAKSITLGEISVSLGAKKRW